VGLDLVEFTLAVEDAFQIAIPDEDAERILTPGQVVDYVVARLGEAEDRVCLEQRAFYRLRRAAMRVFQVTRHRVHPSTPWVELLPARYFRRNWHLLHEATGTPQWPRLSLFGRVRKNATTVGDVAQYLATYAPAALREAKGLRRPDIEKTIARLMEDQFGITSFGWDQQFVRDLKLS